MVDFNDAASIRAWLAVNPQRHLPALRVFWRLWPQFHAAILEATR